MISNKVAIAVALWTLLLAPFLCGLGMVVHACLDDNSIDCHHELACEVDPCQINILHMTARNESGPEDNSSADPIDWALGNSVFSLTALIESHEFEVSDNSLPDLIPCTRTLPLIC